MRSRFLPGAAALIAATLFVAGCGSTPKANEPAESISGKVTLSGEMVGGTVYYIGSDGKEIPGAITTEGKYTVANPPKGEGKFLVKSNLPSLPPGAAAPKKGEEAPPPPDGATGKPPPAKYALPANGIKYSFTGGKQTFDIELTP